MPVVHVITGLVLLTVATTCLVRGQALARREAARGRASVGAGGWAVAGALFTLGGVMQVAVGLLAAALVEGWRRGPYVSKNVEEHHHRPCRQRATVLIAEADSIVLRTRVRALRGRMR
jgi:hypothetical protein